MSDDDWGLEDAHVVCRQLGYPRAVQAPCCAWYGAGSSEMPIWMDNVACTGDETSLAECTFSGWGVAPTDSHAEDASVTCANQPPSPDRQPAITSRPGIVVGKSRAE